MIKINYNLNRSGVITCIKEKQYTDFGARVHRQLVKIYILNVPSISQSLFPQNKMNVSFREIAHLIARNSLVLIANTRSEYSDESKVSMTQACIS